MKVVITQSNYIPWKGYFDALDRADVCVFYDEMQYTRRDWRNRNRIKTRDGLKWLSIPLKVKGKFAAKINEMEVLDQHWRRKHWQQIYHSYRQAPFFDLYAAHFEQVYLQESQTKLSEINHRFLRLCCELLGIEVDFQWSREFELEGGRTEKLLNICKALGATQYISGPSAQAYMDAVLFQTAGIEIHWMDYTQYSRYPQLYGTFMHEPSIIDLLFNLGSDALHYLRPQASQA